MKIHILTQPLGHNFGGNLQAYALQKVLRDMGHDVVTLDRHWNRPHIGLYLFLLRILSSIKAILLTLLGQRRNICSPFNKEYNVLQNKKAIRRFIEKNLKISPSLYGTEETSDFILKNPADCYIVGSDQVWRRAYCPSLSDYYLEAVPDLKRKISYAASFGKDNIDEYTKEEIEFVRLLIKRFDAVSVRENSGIDICKDNFGVEASHLPDPTLLLEAEDYLKLIKKSNETFPTHHLGVYLLDETQEKLHVIDKAVINLGIPSHIINVHEGKNSYIKYPSVESWLANIAYADYVITDSFHGMVFAIIFNKPFTVIGNKNRGLSRFTSLLESLDLKDRLITDCSNDIPLSEINYAPVNDRLKKLREESIQWIMNALA